MSESKRYEIKTLQDILEIPEDRMDAFMPDLKAWHQQVHAWKELLTATADALEVPAEFEVASQGMIWIDDDERKITIHINAKEQPNE